MVSSRKALCAWPSTAPSATNAIQQGLPASIPSCEEVLWWYVIEENAVDAAIRSEIVLIGTTGRVGHFSRCRVLRCTRILAMDEDITTDELASLYALDAVSHDERLQIERWLDLGDSVRRDDFLREVVAVRSTMDVLAVLTAVDPPLRLRLRLRVLARVSRHQHSLRHGRESAQSVHRDFPTKVAAMVAVAIVILGGVAGAVVFDRDSGIPRSEQIVAAPDARMMSTDVVGGGTIAATVSDLLRSVTVEARGLQDVARGGSEFQLWLVSTAESLTVNAGRLDDRRVITGIEGVDALMVTVEPAGGSKQPTQRPVAVIWLV